MHPMAGAVGDETCTRGVRWLFNPSRSLTCTRSLLAGRRWAVYMFCRNGLDEVLIDARGGVMRGQKFQAHGQCGWDTLRVRDKGRMHRKHSALLGRGVTPDRVT